MFNFKCNASKKIKISRDEIVPVSTEKIFFICLMSDR